MLRKALLLTAGILAATLVLGVGLSSLGILEVMRTARLVATVTAYVATPTPTAGPAPTESPTIGPAPTEHSSASLAAGDALAAIVVPPRDSRALAERLRPGGQPIPAVVNATPPARAVGDADRFYLSNSDSREVFSITATLRLLSPHSEMWVEDGVRVDQQALERAAQDFERIYPTVQRHFGSEWSPGVDNDPHVIILNARFSGAAGYYSSQDEFSRQVNPYSNEREMFYMNVDAASPGTERYATILAHEFQHMVHWQLDSNEDTWVNEGASELSARLCGYGSAGGVQAFAQSPDTQLNAWALSPGEDTIPHYGASYLWMEYYQERLGIDSLKSVLTSPENGIAAFEQVLARTPDAPTFDELYADWVIANLLDDPSLEGGRYSIRAASPHMAVQAGPRDLPAQESGAVSQYGTDYINITPRAQGLTIEFAGNAVTPIVPNSPAGGQYEWWSNRGDMSDTTLTRGFDLSGVRRATLEYSLWYALEDGWDYAYVEVSTDGGDTWQPLSTAHTTTYDPNGNAFGPGYTGFSGHQAGATSQLTSEWVPEQVDLTPYAGQQVLVRFEMVTDDAVNLPGLCLDDIAVRELGFSDGAETADAGWQAEGFARIDNRLPQEFAVQVIEEGKTTRVQRMPLDERQHGSLTLNSLDGVERIVLAVSGLTRYTTERASYRYSISAP